MSERVEECKSCGGGDVCDAHRDIPCHNKEKEKEEGKRWNRARQSSTFEAQFMGDGQSSGAGQAAGPGLSPTSEQSILGDGHSLSSTARSLKSGPRMLRFFITFGIAWSSTIISCLGPYFPLVRGKVRGRGAVLVGEGGVFEVSLR